MNAIEVRGLTKQYRDVTAVNDLNLCIEEGELFALLGVNGAGKTTLFNIIARVINSDKGVVIADNTEIKLANDLKGKIGREN